MATSEAFFKDYDSSTFFDEAFNADKTIKPHYQNILETFESYGETEFQRRRALIDLMFRNQGITFTVYGDDKGTERAFPFDPVPRVISSAEWSHLERGLSQRVKVLNLFLKDIYSKQEILKDAIIPSSLVLSNPTSWAAI
jgi:uncharacterized circularly permuted ATP-grasp superfamily protein